MTRWTRYWLIYAIGSCFGVASFVLCCIGENVWLAFALMLGMFAIYAVNVRLLNGEWRL